MTRAFRRLVGIPAMGIAVMGISTLLAWRNLVHDRARLYVAVAGIGFSVLLMGVQLGLMFGFAQTASGLVNHAGADLWVLRAGAQNVDQTPIIPLRWKYEALETPGVRSAEAYVVRFSVLRKPDGGSESVLVVGYDLVSGLGGPWAIVEGDTAMLRQSGGVVVDRLYLGRLGVNGVGDTVEIAGKRARIVGLTRGVRTFVQSPYVFTSFANGQMMSAIQGTEANFILVRLDPGQAAAPVARALEASIQDAQVLTSAQFARKTVAYWLFSTGVGIYLLLGCSLGIIVGVAITAQTLYASVSDQLPEFATLRAMGATDAYLKRVILQQAILSGAIGYVAGMIAALVIVGTIGDGSVAMVLPWQAVIGLGVLAIAMCAASGLLAIRRVMRTEPTSIFR